MKNDRRIVMMNDSRYDRNGGRSGGAASGGAMPPHGKVRRLPLRERDVYRAAIRAHLAPKERVREAALAARPAGRGRPGRPAAQAAACTRRSSPRRCCCAPALGLPRRSGSAARAIPRAAT